MDNLNNLIQQANKCYAEGMAHKNEAIKNDNNLDLFLKAADAYLKAANCGQKALKLPDLSRDFTALTSALISYYLYEASECRYGYEYKHGKFDQAILIAEEGKKHIDNALKVIDDNISSVSPKIKQKLMDHKINWTLSSLTIKLRILEPIAKRSMLKKDFLTALDTYRELGHLQDQVHNYTSISTLPQVYKRTEEANYLASKASIAMSLAGLYLKKPDFKKYDKEILEQLLMAYDFSKKGLTSNPEQERYKEGVENIFENISEFLKENESRWLDYLIEFKANQHLKIIMQITNNDKYKKEKAKLELENNGLKKFLLIGSFWIGLMFAVFYIVMHIAESNILWYRFLAVIFFLPLLVTVIGGFILRSTDGLKEENFIKLMTLALKINLQGLKVLSSKSEANKRTS